jgi:hypothetical protein
MALDALTIKIEGDNKQANKALQETMKFVDQLAAKWAKQFQVVGAGIKPGGLENLVNSKINVSQLDRAAIQAERAAKRIRNSMDTLSTNRATQGTFSQMFNLGVVSEMPRKLSKFDKVLESIFSKEELAAMNAAKRTKTYNNLWTANERFAAKSERAYRKLSSTLSNTKERELPFRGYAMSIMFAGMAIQRTFDQIWVSGTKAFQEISHSVEGTVTQYDMLDGSVKYLQYTMGAALEPVVGMILPIIDALGNLIDKHPELFKWIFIVGSVLGALFTIGGAGALAIDGFLNLAIKLGFFQLTAEGAIIPTFTLAGALKALTATTIIGGIMLLITWIYKLGEAMGGPLEFAKALASGIIKLIMLLSGAVWGIILEIKNGLDWLWNKLIDGLQWSIDQIEVLVNKVIDGINKLFKTKIGDLDLGIDLSGAKAEVKDFGTSFLESIGTSMEAFMILQDTLGLTPTKGYAEFNGLIPEFKEQPKTQASTTNNFYIQGFDMQKTLEEANRYVEAANTNMR